MTSFIETHIDTIKVDGIEIFYREAGSPNALTILLLHGYPSSSFQFRNLIPILATKYRVVAPDLPSYGFTVIPEERGYEYTFESFAKTIGVFIDALVYAFHEKHSHLWLRLALQRPESIKAIISQNGNAYEEGLGSFWDPVKDLWKKGITEETKKEVASFTSYEGIKGQYTNGTPDPHAIPPETYHLDYYLVKRPNNEQTQLNILYDYRTNLPLYPKFQEYFRKYQPPTLAVWGKNDEIFVPAGAEAFKKDLPKAVVKLLNTGHFALETNVEEIGRDILSFLEEQGFDWVISTVSDVFSVLACLVVCAQYARVRLLGAHFQIGHKIYEARDATEQRQRLVVGLSPFILITRFSACVTLNMASTSKLEVSHPVVFTTQSAYPLPSQKFMIPGSWRRYQLSQLVNKSLSLAKPVPFDFLVRGEILRTTLEEWCAEKGIGEEETLEIEYFESVMPPQKITSLPHEDWVSSVSCREKGCFVTASYDGALRIFDYSQALLQSVPVHEAALTSVEIVPCQETGENSRVIATASHDLTARLTRVPLSATSSETSAQVLASLHLHTAPLTSVASNASGSHLLTASVDGLIGFWDTTVPEKDDVPPEDVHSGSDRKKRRRLDDGEIRTKRKAPLAVLKSHTAQVSKAAFLQGKSENALSVGLDSTVRTWDTEHGVCTHTITASSKPFVDLAVTSNGQTVLAASTDRSVCQYDLRLGESSVTTAPLASFMHPATPSCLATLSSSTGSEHQFISGAYDGVVRLWDLRSTKSAVTSFKVWENRASGRKVLSVDWAYGMVAIGGEGGVEVWRVDEGDRLNAA
ncbi:hypothetical protein EIP86_006887 [Pleurotus ostreatoroseus]|nr:hypothetical protein EIP86_006887 [Pleurotus ostreatoroseus]